MCNVTIIGGGASGLTSAIFAARGGHNVTILEHNKEAGKKINATGNGKCNYMNTQITDTCFRGSAPRFAYKVIECFGIEEIKDFFKQLGILPHNRNGYCYPYSEQASSIRKCLLNELKKLSVSIITDVTVISTQKNSNGFLTEYKETDSGSIQKLVSDKLILATGGMAAPMFGTDGSGYTYAKSFGHRIVKPLPALVQLCCSGKQFKTIAGVRCEADIVLFSSEKAIISEHGEIIFTKYGISGIPVMQLSRYAAALLDNNQKPSLIIDFVPKLNHDELLSYIMERISDSGRLTAEEALNGLLNDKLMYILLLASGIDPVAPACHISSLNISKLAKLIKAYCLEITATNGFDNAQVTAGGVNTDQINYVNMESKLVSGLYIIGELVDIDGTCGGYNLMWAWSTGALAGRAI